MPNNKTLNDEYTWKRKITYIYRNTLALPRLTQCQVMLFRYVYTTVLCLRTHALMLAVPVFNTADAIMPSCRK